ncbi:PEPxxWA-CTERM sorting domain-containing protein [Sphingomonas sp. MG17]|uniref:PEPxxWA-CTERM sorting domain-containing protein n=1 Tax=Sphingomonas tagetis TaxID=2949092 RepID=A0A9X2HJ81_9SPHN|nr:PEPxxWA-CTERM sorting domain-containing protein [Sphingomonas tagetis]MCP3730627.1 PEPxxWA-CTERM sorting domain-containing protein [Sphingomonas tagetis]
MNFRHFFEFSYANANGAPINLIEAVDNITFNTAISAVPEPATWIMMLRGFGSIGFAIRRRKVAINTVSHNFA